MARLERLRAYPVKGFDGVEVDAADVTDGGTLEHDREFALFDAGGGSPADGRASLDSVVNGKRTERVHLLSTDYDPESAALTVETPDGESRRFELDREDERERAAAWFGDFLALDADLDLRRDATRGFVDRREMGPSVVSTATLREIASWFDELSVEGVRRRLRANVEISGVPPFWEDRFVGEGAPAFDVGGVRFEGVTPCGRCVVPGRDPDTGESLPEFRKRFVEKRRETFPEWADAEAFEHHFVAMLIARVPESDRGRRLRVGDPVSVVE